MSSVDLTPSKIRFETISFWIAKGLLALVFGASGAAKFAGVAMLVANFDKIGLGQGFRYVTGATEWIGVIALLMPATTFYGVLILAGVCVGAFFAELGPLHGDIVHVIGLAALVGAVGWHSRPKRPLDGSAQPRLIVKS